MVGTNPSLVKQEHDAGHSIASHSFTHPDLMTLEPSVVVSEFLETTKRVRNEICADPKLYRPPFGKLDSLRRSTLRHLGLRAVQWNVDSLDWQMAAGTLTAEQVLDNVRSIQYDDPPRGGILHLQVRRTGH